MNMKLKIKTSTIFGLIGVGGAVIALFVHLYKLHSKEEIRIAESEFVFLMADSNKIDEINVIYNWGKTAKNANLKDKKIIKEICDALKINYGETSFIGGYGDRYLLNFRYEGKNYRIRYYKDIQYNDKCKKQLTVDGHNYFGNNPLNDCGQLVILKNPDCDEKEISKGCSEGVVVLRNLHLIPIINKYIDPLIKQRKYNTD